MIQGVTDPAAVDRFHTRRTLMVMMTKTTTIAIHLMMIITTMDVEVVVARAVH